MYSDLFCKVYNVFGWNYYPEIFGQQLVQWLAYKGFAPKSALDLACGTGILCRILADQGIQTAGMDLSPGMIEIARQADDRICYEVGDMTAYRPAQPVDLVTCTGDAVNHIPDPEDLEKIFRNVFGYLNPGGWFVFDLLNEQEVSDSEPFEMDYDDRTRVWFRMTRPAQDRVNLQIRVFEGGALALEENIRERIYAPEEIVAMLQRSGFGEIRCADRLLEDGNPGTTWFVTARKGVAP